MNPHPHPRFAIRSVALILIVSPMLMAAFCLSVATNKPIWPFLVSSVSVGIQAYIGAGIFRWAVYGNWPRTVSEHVEAVAQCAVIGALLGWLAFATQPSSYEIDLPMLIGASEVAYALAFAIAPLVLMGRVLKEVMHVTTYRRFSPRFQRFDKYLVRTNRELD